ncbi:MAG: hypothetical protein M0P94_04955 [Candidatus Absconditabacterales bacterium]|nr:hypothetical protein [Candidatus Absconditabacterales bacterium]
MIKIIDGYTKEDFEKELNKELKQQSAAKILKIDVKCGTSIMRNYYYAVLETKGGQYE